MEIFRPGLNLDYLLSDVVTFGGTFVPEAFTREYLDYLNEELDGLEYGQYQSSDEAKVYERHRDFRARIYDTKVAIPHLRELVEYIGWQIRAASVPRAHNHLFYPDDVNVWRYSDESSGIGRHRDYSHDLFLIVGVTTRGCCTLEFYGDDPENRTPKIWQAGPGSLMLLRGPGFCERDDRPWHAVNPPVHGERVSIIIRQDIRNSQVESTKEY
ncbi:MAG: hypothetical protein U0516_04305 [Candidatus Saccharibacteria bacterium]